MKPLFPLFLDLAGRPVLVVGGGAIATRKALDLADAQADVLVVAKEISPDLAGLRAEARAFEERDVEGRWLVFAATDDAAVQHAIADACSKRQIFCVAVDDPPNASAYGGAILRRGPITLAISTSGEAPALARLLREVLEQALPEDDWIEAAREMRERWKSEKTPMTSRFGELVAAFKARV